MTLLFNSPCVAMWVPFNEGWGQFDANKAVEAIRMMDDTRTIDHASGWHDQKSGERPRVFTYTINPTRYVKDTIGRAVVLSEFGGYSQHLSEHSFSPKEFGYKRFKSARWRFRVWLLSARGDSGKGERALRRNLHATIGRGAGQTVLSPMTARS